MSAIDHPRVVPLLCLTIGFLLVSGQSIDRLDMTAASPREPFGADYAGFYDATYADKDYQRECDLIEEIFRRYAGREVRSVLDLGCGTGGHAVLLAKRGFKVTGLDIAAPMIEVARRKALAEGLEIDLRQGNLRTTDLGRSFDAALMMFAVLGYQRENKDVIDALTNIRRHLKPQLPSHLRLLVRPWGANRSTRAT